jgi:hypothetical protein
MGVGVSMRHRAVSPAEAPSEARRAPFDTPGILLGVGVVLALGVALRFVCNSDLWADEALSVNIARLPIDRIPAALRHDGAPPLYYLALHLWMRLFGTGDATVRALSGVIGTVTLVPVWFVGRRIDDRRRRIGLAPPDAPNVVAWSTLLLFALSPFAIRYSTEARMYALVMLLAACGYLAVVRALDRASPVRLVPVAVVAGLLLYSHYWAFPLLAVAGVTLAVVAVRGDHEHRRAALLTLAAIGVGCLTFVPWVPTLLFQMRHTGTPWGAPVSPFGSWALAFSTFGGNAHPAGWAIGALVALGVFATAGGRRHIEIDLGTQRGVRIEAAVALGTVTLGLLMGRVAGTTFEARYASVAFPLLVVVAAFGLLAFGDARVRLVALGVVLVLGAWGGISNVARQRTQAFEVVPVIRDRAAPQDLVVFCPDVIGTDVVGQLPTDVRTTSFPNSGSSARIDWVDYASHVHRADPETYARRFLRLAGDHTIWFVYTNNGAEADQKCEKIADFLTLARPNRTRELEPDPYFYEHQGVYRYPPFKP